ncbi:MAG TPA: sugar phosphate isomerase/epimerase family protein [Tepidisphaeraceae bacterium]|nr:sugar phosphate isomerase/epimerase family protein [Tepidisphaeraceae bacterium]
MKSAVTVSLVPEAKGGPFVFWNDLPAACEKAARLGFDAVEIFAPGADAIAADLIGPLLERNNLKLAAVGTGGGWVRHKLSLTSPDAHIRAKAREFGRSIVDAAGRLGAPAIIGSIQGRWGDSISRQDAIASLAEALNDLGEHACQYKVPLFYEPLNRYETNIANTLEDATGIIRSLKTSNVKVLADLYHMNIDESNLSSAIRSAGSAVGHVHLADSNRRPAGNGHTDFRPIAATLRDIRYAGYLSAECLPWPDSDSAAAQTIQSFRQYFTTQ